MQVFLDSFRHYEFVKNGDVYELYEYGPECPHMHDGVGGYYGRYLFTTVPVGADVEFVFGLSGCVQFKGFDFQGELGKVYCGDDFIRELRYEFRG